MMQHDLPMLADKACEDEALERFIDEMTLRKKAAEKLEDIFENETWKEYLTFYSADFDWNEDIIYSLENGIELVLYLAVDIAGAKFGMKVSRGMLNSWNITNDEALHQAVSNISRDRQRYLRRITEKIKWIKNVYIKHNLVLPFDVERLG